MARAGGLSSGLNLFGGGSTSFGSFSLTGSSSAAETASLAYSVARAKHDAGLMTDAEFESAQATYLNGLDQTTAAGATAAYTISMQKYTDDRNALAAQVQQGADPSLLAQFDQQSLAGLSPGSNEYQQRLGRLYDSQQAVFQQAEKTVIDNLSNGRITNAQAQSWYQDQLGAYSQNPQVRSDVTAKIKTLGDRIIADQDQAMSNAWNKGTMTIQQVVAYTTAAIASDPTSTRAKDLGTFLDTAKSQAIEASLNERYKLTREYHTLEAYVTGAVPPAGHTTTSHKTTTYLDANGKWVTTTTTAGTYHAPTATQQAAWKAAQTQVAEAKTRMAQIKGEVSAIPGGWVTEDDMIAYLTKQQAGVVHGSKQWFDYQDQIDGLNQRKAQDKVEMSKGIHVAYPGVSSEGTQDITVSSTERPTKAGVPAKAGSVKATGSSSSSSGSGSGSGGGSAASLAAAASNPTIKGSVAGGGGPLSLAFQQIVSSSVRGTPKQGSVESVKTRTGIPVNLSAQSFKTFRDEYVAAVKGGHASFTDKVTGANYAIPLNAADRLDALKALDATWMSLNTAQLGNALADPKRTSATVQRAYTKYNGAYQSTVDNIWYVLDSATPGAVITRDENGKTVAVGVAGKARSAGSGATRDQNGKVTSTSVTFQNFGEGPANPLGLATEVLDAAKNYADLHSNLAKDAYGRGDYAQAAAFIAQIGTNNAKVTKQLYGVDGKGGLMGTLLKDVPKDPQTGEPILPSGKTGPVADFTRLANGGDELAAELDATAQIQSDMLGPDPNNPGGGFLAVSNGKIVTDKSGNPVLKDGYFRTMGPDGAISVKQYKATGLGPDGATYTTPGSKTLVANVKMGNTVEPVMVPYEVGQVGTLNGAPVMGKIITDPRDSTKTYILSPFQPGVAIPTDKGKFIEFSAPAGAQLLDATQTSKIKGLEKAVQNGDTVFAFTGNDGSQYIVVNDSQTGTSQVFMHQTTSGSMMTLGTDQAVPLDTVVNGSPVAGAKVLADNGWGINQSGLNADQQAAYDATAVFGKDLGVGGAYLGMSSKDWGDMFGKQEVLATFKRNVEPVLGWVSSLFARVQAGAGQQPSDVSFGGGQSLPGQSQDLLAAIGSATQRLGATTGYGTPTATPGYAGKSTDQLPGKAADDAAAVLNALPPSKVNIGTASGTGAMYAGAKEPIGTQNAYTAAVKSVTATKAAATKAPTPTVTAPKVTPPPAPAPLPGKSNTTRL